MSDSELAIVSSQTFQAPVLIERASPSTRKKFFEFFTVPIRNANTRAAYYRAIQQFLAWAERAGVIQGSTHTGLRDRALLGTLAYTFARIGAVVNLKVQDYYPSGKRFFLRFKEKGGKGERASRAPQVGRAPGRVPESDRSRQRAKLSFVSGRLGKNRKAIATAAGAHRRR